MNDNRQLRAKIHSLEKENQLVHDRSAKVEAVVRVSLC
jgi:hypothetical protein